MLKEFKHKIVAVVLGYLLLHFTATICYVAPESMVPNRLRGYASWYMMPVFHQQWDLFAPEPPKTSHRIYYRFKNKKGKWSKWIDPGKEIREAHHAFRVGYPGKLYITYFNLLYYLAADVYVYKRENSENTLLPGIKKTYSYDAIIHYLKQHTINQYGVTPTYLLFYMEETKWVAPGKEPEVTKITFPYYTEEPVTYIKDIPEGFE